MAREVIETSSGSGAGWFVAGILVVALIGGAVLFANGYFDGGGKSLTINVDPPKIDAPKPGQ
ncbi:MAG: hypothetical protein AB7O39_13075 [Flavobacteriaceae bacterium]